MESQIKKSRFIFFSLNVSEYYHSPNKTQLFLLTQLLTLLLGMIITGLMQLSNHLAIYLVKLSPVYFLIVIIQYLVKKKLSYYNFWAYTFHFILPPIFYGVFFGIFHPTASLDFKLVQNCQMTGSLSDSIERYENYAILYINFELDGEQYLGAACSSDQNQHSTTTDIYPYKFYYKFNDLTCHKYESDNTDSNDSRRLLQTPSYNNNTQHRFLQYDYSECTRQYLWSRVKIASWICLERGFDLEKYQQSQSCYVHFLGGSQAIQNGLNRTAMKDEDNFPLISYTPRPYYPQVDLICLIVFTYYLWLLSFNTLFYKKSKSILRELHRFHYKMEQLVDQQQNPYDHD